MQDHIGLIILAAGRGKRMNAKDINKVALHIGGKPLIVYGVELGERLHLSPIIVVVGHAKESVIQVLKEKKVVFAHQDEQIGTADALRCGLTDIPEEVEDILVIQGDDSYLYSPEVILSLIEKHTQSKAAMTFLTLTLAHPTGIGRIIRDKKGRILKIVEEKDASIEEKKVTEVNAACYIFNMKFLTKYLPTIQKNPKTDEYYLTDIINIAVTNNESIIDVPAGNLTWKGINTQEDFAEAQQLYSKLHS